MAHVEDIAEEACENMEAHEPAASSSTGGQSDNSSGGVACRPETCPAFFIGDDDSDAGSCSALTVVDDEWGAGLMMSRLTGPLTLEAAIDALSTTASSGFEGPSRFDGSSRDDCSKLEWKQLELSHFQWSAMREILSTFSDEMLRFRQELRSLTEVVDGERRERLAALEHSKVVAGKLASALDKEISERLAGFERLKQEGRQSAVANAMATRTCITAIDEISRALERETRARVASELSVHQAFQMLRGEFEEEIVQGTHLVNDLKNSLDRDLTLYKERCEEQEQLASDVKEVLEAVQCERQDRIRDVNAVKNSLTKVQTGIGEVCQRIEDETLSLSQEIKTEKKERADGHEDIGHRLDELRRQLDEVVRSDGRSSPTEFKSALESFFF